jgi:tryptophan synthase beta subunit
VIKSAPAMPKDRIIIVNLSGRGDKDAETIAEMKEGKE